MVSPNPRIAQIHTVKHPINMPKTLNTMTRDRADEIVKTINTNIGNAGALLMEYRDKEGWKIQGYSSFKEACEKEFSELYGGRSQIYRLIQQHEVSVNVSPRGDTQLHTGITRELGKLPPEKQVEAFSAASENGHTPTTKEVKREVEKTAATIPKPKKKTAEVSATKLEAALARIGLICGKDVRTNIEKGVLSNIGDKEAIFWAKLEDEQMADIQELVVTKRWKPSVAWKQVSKMVDGSTRLTELTNLCIAAGGSWEGTIEGFNFVVTAPEPSKAPKKRK